MYYTRMYYTYIARNFKFSFYFPRIAATQTCLTPSFIRL